LVVSVARVDPEKRPFDAIEIVRKAHAKVPQLKFQWIGTGTLLEKARAYASDHPYITFTGFVDEMTKWRALTEAAAFIFTSEREGFGTTIAQALLAETPVITYDLPVHRSIFDDTIIYAPCFDIQAFSEQLLRVLLHPEPYRDMAKKGRNLVEEKYSTRAFGDRVETALYTMISAERHRPQYSSYRVVK
jgi:glycosyltransferase involved in cell wall biosynthesis